MEAKQWNKRSMKSPLLAGQMGKVCMDGEYFNSQMEAGGRGGIR